MIGDGREVGDALAEKRLRGGELPRQHVLIIAARAGTSGEAGEYVARAQQRRQVEVGLGKRGRRRTRVRLRQPEGQQAVGTGVIHPGIPEVRVVHPVRDGDRDGIVDRSIGVEGDVVGTDVPRRAVQVGVVAGVKFDGQTRRDAAVAQRGPRGTQRGGPDRLKHESNALGSAIAPGVAQAEPEGGAEGEVGGQGHRQKRAARLVGQRRRQPQHHAVGRARDRGVPVDGERGRGEVGHSQPRGVQAIQHGQGEGQGGQQPPGGWQGVQVDQVPERQVRCSHGFGWVGFLGHRWPPGTLAVRSANTSTTRAKENLPGVVMLVLWTGLPNPGPLSTTSYAQDYPCTGAADRHRATVMAKRPDVARNPSLPATPLSAWRVVLG